MNKGDMMGNMTGATDIYIYILQLINHNQDIMVIVEIYCDWNNKVQPTKSHSINDLTPENLDFPTNKWDLANELATVRKWDSTVK